MSPRVNPMIQKPHVRQHCFDWRPVESTAVIGALSYILYHIKYIK